jgi:hypothetical protein
VIELAAVIWDLRAELEAAVAAADGAGLVFELGPVELEVSVALERSGSGGARVRFWVVEADAQGKAVRTGTQKVKLSLTPRLAGTDVSPKVSGQAVPGES